LIDFDVFWGKIAQLGIKNTRHNIAMPAFFALLANKITAYKLVTLFGNKP
jgi:hypothetical protein